MSKEKQIEEMASALNFCKNTPIEECHSKVDCKHCLAEQLYNAGYRKQSEIAEEIFAEADKIFMATCLSLETYKAWCELKKKYTKEQTDG